MSVSQPSRAIYLIDVPEVKHFEVKYHYNFFVPDESVNETGGVPSNVLSKNSDDIDASFVQYSVTRVPRFVEFRWHKPKIADVGGAVSELASRANSFKNVGEQKGSLILDNIDKVVTEDDFASKNFSAVHFHDGHIDRKIHELVSGSMVQASLEEEHDHHVSHYKAAHQFIPLLPGYIKPHWIFRSMTLPNLAYGAEFYIPATASANTKAIKTGLFDPKQGTRVFNDYFRRLKHVTTNAQINTKFMHDLVNRTIRDPSSTNAHDLVNMHQYSKALKQSVSQRYSMGLSEVEFKTFVPFVNVKRQHGSVHAEKYGAELVGYIIDKLEIQKNGTIRNHPPIIIDNPHVGISADFQVKFNAKYCYTIRSVALIRIPAIDDVTGEIAVLKILVSSKPTNKEYISTLKLDAPPPPADFNFIWNYQPRNDGRPRGLRLTWAFPVTSERDIKQFQIFKRAHVNHAFELQKVYNFDDSVVPFPPRENADPKLVERMVSPLTSWHDGDFDWDVNNSRHTAQIYAVCSVDAHGLTSNYSAQFRVWFDRYKNKLQKELVSHAGAPKPYPNMYLDNHLFENTIRVRGPHTKRMRLFFNPEYYYLTDDSNRHVKVLQTLQNGGGYRLQFINIDNLKSSGINIHIDDKTLQTSGRMAFPTMRFGPKRKALPL